MTSLRSFITLFLAILFVSTSAKHPRFTQSWHRRRPLLPIPLPPSPSPNPNPPSGGGGGGKPGSQVYKLNQSNRGSSFFDNWTFWSTADPTHGSVAYQTKSAAQSQNLIGVNNAGQAFARASNKDIPKGQNRPSVRFESNQAYDEAVIVFDVAAMPAACMAWPALWTNWGSNWPNGGEADVLEQTGYTAGGTNANQYSVHMGDDSPNQAASNSFTGKEISSNCLTNYQKNENGCSIRDSNNNGPSWGPAFNSANGGIFVVQFGNNNGVKTWFFGRQHVPAQLGGTTKYAAPTIDVSTLGEPSGSFQSPIINQKFKQQTIVVDITIQGDWNAPPDGPCAGQDRATALSIGKNYDTAEFLFNAINIYTQ